VEETGHGLCRWISVVGASQEAGRLSPHVRQGGQGVEGVRALEYRECVGDDMQQPKWGIPFQKRVKPKKGEVIVFSWIVYKSRAHRDRIVPKIMQDKRLATQTDPKTMPFDMKRMSYGGFKVLVDM
jgi:uncharacterized protein YbaA (DUF1428 family)